LSARRTEYQSEILSERKEKWRQIFIYSPLQSSAVLYGENKVKANGPRKDSQDPMFVYQLAEAVRGREGCNPG
jgi:hypothetical protein